jgi:hypothetical protein
MSLLEKLPHWLETKPLVLLRFSDGFAQAIAESKNGLSRFTFAKPHGSFHELKLPTLCLVEMRDGATRKCFVGVAKTKAAITTLDSRLTVLKLQSLDLASLEAIGAQIAESLFRTKLKQKLETPYLAQSLSPQLSTAIVEALAADPANRKAIEAAAFHIPKLRKIASAEWEQFDAIKTAMAAFGLSKSAFPENIEVPADSDSTLNYLDSHYDPKEEETGEASVLEDNVIAKDASLIPGFELIEKHMTGRAVFFKAGERLEVYTANKGPLEVMLGVDLIYVNEFTGNMVMVQYKMLTTHTDPVTVKTDWIFRPDDQFKLEVGRMKLLPVNAKADDYRLHRSPFFFKFVKRKGDGKSHASFLVSLDHLNQYLASAKSKGPKGGVRISFESLEGVYLREADLLGLIRSGYIGTHRIETDALKPIINAVSEGKRALVLAWQKTIEEKGHK